MVSDLYLLPPQILPCEHIDTPNLRFLNSDFAPLRHPFGDNFNIESYNTSWFDDAPVSRPPDFLLDKSFLDISAKKVKPLSDTIREKYLKKMVQDDSPTVDSQNVLYKGISRRIRVTSSYVTPPLKSAGDSRGLSPQNSHKLPPMGKGLPLVSG